MSLSVAGVKTVVPLPDFKEWVANNINPRDVMRWRPRSWPGFGTVGLTEPTGFQLPYPVVLNELVWPIPASRWGYMHLVLDANMLNAVHDAAFGTDGTKYNRVRLLIDDPGVSNEQISALMWMLPPTQLSSVSSGGFAVVPGTGPLPPGDPKTNDYYIITLVDDRYWWWGVPFNVTTPIIDSTTWVSLLAMVSNSLTSYGLESIAMSTVNAAYLNASPAFTLPYEAVPPIVDAIAYNVGMRFSRNWSGGCVIETSTDANTRMVSDFSSHPKRTLLAGGDRFPSNRPYP